MILGVTGCVGAGKSTVAAILGGFGARVLDVDEVAARALRESSLGLSPAQALHAVVTNSPDSPRIHAALVPVVQARVEAWAKESTTPGVLEAAILFEYGLERFCDLTLCVTCPPEERKRRVLARSTASARLFEFIEASQWSEAAKAARCSESVDGTLPTDALYERLSKVWALQTKA